RTPISSLSKPPRVTQHIGQLTPHFAAANAMTTYHWLGCCYLTRELGPETVKALLESHPELSESDKKLREADIAARRMRKIDFYGQAGWYDLAEKELEQMESDLPSQKKRVGAARITLARIRARDNFEEIKRWHQAGRHNAVRKRLAAFPEKQAPEEVVSRVR